MVLITCQSDAIALTDMFKQAIDLQLCDIVVLRDEDFDVGIQTLVDVKCVNIIVRQEDKWVKLKHTQKIESTITRTIPNQEQSEEISN